MAEDVLSTSAGACVLRRTPITSPDQISDALTYDLAFFPLEAAPGAQRHGRRLTITRWNGIDDNERLKRLLEMDFRRKALAQILRKLVRKGVDVAVVVNALYVICWRKAATLDPWTSAPAT